jgi:hypothetical protein
MAEEARGRTAFVAVILAGIASIGSGCYCLLRAFDVFDVSPDFAVWFARAVVAILIGVAGLHIGGRRVGLS